MYSQQFDEGGPQMVYESIVADMRKLIKNGHFCPTFPYCELHNN
jgi:hypothetical protein